MFFRTLLIAAVALTFVACSSKDKGAGDENTNFAGSGPLAGTEVGNGAGLDGAGNVVPGSQQDLAVNVGDRVFFGYDRTDLSPEARRTLDLQAEWLKRYPNVSVTVEGHADERGTREYNLALGERRANTIRSYLASVGVDGSRLSTISYGKERPAVVGADDTSFAQNRRGVTTVN